MTIKHIVAAAVAVPVALVLLYILWSEVGSRWRSRRIFTGSLRPKCYACGARDQRLPLIERLHRQQPFRHTIRWRHDVMKNHVTCWKCGAQWALDSFMETQAKIKPASWSIINQGERQ